MYSCKYCELFKKTFNSSGGCFWNYVNQRLALANIIEQFFSLVCTHKSLPFTFWPNRLGHKIVVFWLRSRNVSAEESSCWFDVSWIVSGAMETLLPGIDHWVSSFTSWENILHRDLLNLHGRTYCLFEKESSRPDFLFWLRGNIRKNKRTNRKE